MKIYLFGKLEGTEKVKIAKTRGKTLTLHGNNKKEMEIDYGMDIKDPFKEPFTLIQAVDGTVNNDNYIMISAEADVKTESGYKHKYTIDNISDIKVVDMSEFETRDMLMNSRIGGTQACAKFFRNQIFASECGLAYDTSSFGHAAKYLKYLLYAGMKCQYLNRNTMFTSCNGDESYMYTKADGSKGLVVLRKVYSKFWVFNNNKEADIMLDAIEELLNELSNVEECYNLIELMSSLGFSRYRMDSNLEEKAYKLVDKIVEKSKGL